MLSEPLRSISVLFQSSISKCLYLEEVLASISWSVAPGEMLSWFCPSRFGVVFCGVVLGIKSHITLLDRAVSGVTFLAGGVSECDLSHRRSALVSCILYKIRSNWMYQVCGARSAFCASEGYTWCLDRASVFLCTSSLPNLTVPQDYYTPLSIIMESALWRRVRLFETVGF